MKIRDVMTQCATCLPPGTTLEAAARKIRELDCHFLPVRSASDGRPDGVISAREIILRTLAEGLDPTTAIVDQVKTEGVLYCYEDDELGAAAERMHAHEVYRMVVLGSLRDNRITGIVSFGDLVHYVAAAALNRRYEHVHG